MNKSFEPAVEDSADARRRANLREVPVEYAAQAVGQELREMRLRRGDDLTTVSRVLRIRRDHLEAIEDGRVDDLPGRTYAVGFVRSYAEYLGLDPAGYVDRFKGEIAGRSEPSPLRGLPPDTGENRLPYGWLFMALLVLGLVGYAGYHLVRSADLPTSQPVAPVPAAMAPEPPRHAPKQPAHAQQASLAPRSNPKPASGTAQPVAATPATGTLSNPAAQAATANPPASLLAALPPGQVFGTQNRNARVILHARAVTHVLVEGPGGKVYINRILHPGDAYRVPDLVGLSLTTPDGGAVLLELDGQEMGVAGRSGQMTEALSLDPQAIVDRAGGKTPAEGNQVTP